MALGAERADVLGLVITAGLRLVAAGAAIGLIVSLLLGRAIEADVSCGVKPHDPCDLSGHQPAVDGSRCVGLPDVRREEQRA